MVTTGTECFNIKIHPFSLQAVFNIVRIRTNNVKCGYFLINKHEEEEEEREKEIRSRDMVKGTTLIWVLISPQPDQEGNGSPDTCNPEETVLHGLPMS
jgi:hypothetical protein